MLSNFMKKFHTRLLPKRPKSGVTHQTSVGNNPILLNLSSPVFSCESDKNLSIFWHES